MVYEMSKRFEIDGGFIFDNEIDDFLDIEDTCNVMNEQQRLIKEKNNVITLMGAFIKSKGFSVDDFDEWVSEDWHISDEKYKIR